MAAEQAKESPQQKRARMWRTWAAKRRGPARPQEGPPPAEEGSAYRTWRDRDRARAGLLRRLEEPGPPDPLAGAVEQYCLLVSHDGEYPRVQVHGGLEELCRAVGRLEGKDVAVWPFRGVVLPVSRGPTRAVLMPDGRAALVPRGGVGLFRVLEPGLASFDVQEDGYVGPEALVVGKMAARLDVRARKAREEAEDDDAEFDLFGEDDDAPQPDDEDDAEPVS